MEVILKKDYPGLGYEGDVCKVKNGFARNYLLPQKIAVIASEANKRILKDLQVSLEKKRAKRREGGVKLKERLEDVDIKVTVKVGDNDKLYGSVGTPTILNALNSKGFSVLKKDVLLDHPIKELGVSKVGVKVYEDIVAEVKVWVVKEEKSEEEKRAEAREQAEREAEAARLAQAEQDEAELYGDDVPVAAPAAAPSEAPAVAPSEAPAEAEQTEEAKTEA